MTGSRCLVGLGIHARIEKMHLPGGGFARCRMDAVEAYGVRAQGQEAERSNSELLRRQIDEPSSECFL